MKLKILLLLILTLGVLACYTERGAKKKRQANSQAGDKSLVMVTGYCNCGKCCGWKRSWFGFGAPVYDYGKLKGKPKKVGITATGKKAKMGTIAADPKVFKFGTKMTIPGYGEGVVEDIGGAIKGKHIDLWFPSHEAAKKWGVKYIPLSKLNVRK